MTSDKPRAVFSMKRQIFLLLASAIFLSQALTILAVTLLPPPQPPLRTLGQVADALLGFEAPADEAAQFNTRSVSSLPERFSMTPQGIERLWRDQLARQLDTTPENVRVHREEPTVFSAMAAGRMPVSNAPGGRRFGGQRPDFTGAPGSGESRLDLPRPPFGFGPHGAAGDGPGEMARLPPRAVPPVIMGQFSAAYRRDDGSWIIVSPPPQLSGMFRMMIWFAGGILVVSPLAFWFANRLTAPVQRFADAAEQLGRNPEGASLTVEGPAEIGIAAEAFNRMQQRLKRYVRDRVNTISTISHDLRIPLTRLRFRAECASPALRDGILSDVDKMEAMISEVLAFMKGAGASGAREDVDLAGLLDDVAKSMGRLGSLTVRTNEPLIVEGNPRSLERLFINLIDNAQKYGGGRVSIVVDQENEGHAVVAVRDRGPGIAVEEREQVFQPFYRTDKTRERAQGAGLGLTSARAIARAHGGDIILSDGGPGLVARVEIPLSAIRSTAPAASS